MSGDEPLAGIGAQVARGAAWTISFRLAERLLGLISTLVLARLLTPADFGIVALAVTLITLIEVVTVGEFSSAIIQHPSPTRDHYDSAWSLSAMFGVAAAVIMVAAAHPTAAFFREPRLVPVVYALSTLPVLDGFFNMGCVDFRKHLQFHKDFVLLVGRKLSAFAVVLPLAFLFRSYWALVGGMVAGRMAGLVLSYALHPFRPRFSLRSARSLFGFSQWLMLNNGLTFLSQRGAHLVIGRLIGSQGLGLYTISDEMANLPTSELAMPINRAVFPGYSKLQHDLPALQQGFLQVIGLIALVAVPAGLGMAAVAHLFVPVVLGERWLPAVPVIRILAIGGAIHVLQTNVESLYYAVGRPRFRAMMTLLEIFVFLPLVVLLLKKFGLPGAALAFLLSVSIIVPINFSVALRTLSLNAWALVRVLWRPVVAALLMALIVHAIFPDSQAQTDTWANITSLALAVSLGAAAYSVMLSALWLGFGRPDGAETWLLTQARQWLSRKRDATAM